MQTHRATTNTVLQHGVRRQGLWTDSNWGGNIQNVHCPFFFFFQTWLVTDSVSPLPFVYEKTSIFSQMKFLTWKKKMDKTRFECYLLIYRSSKFGPCSLLIMRSPVKFPTIVRIVEFRISALFFTRHSDKYFIIGIN